MTEKYSVISHFDINFQTILLNNRWSVEPIGAVRKPFMQFANDFVGGR
jgi:hypothetical protein